MHLHAICLLLLAPSCASTALPSLSVPEATANPNARLQERQDTSPTPTTPPSPVRTGYQMTTELIIIPGLTNGYITNPAKTIELVIPTCVATDVPDKNGHVPPESCKALWSYYPSFTAALVFTLGFVALTIGHVWQAVVYKKAFCWVIIVGALWETCAFTFRTISTRNQQSDGVYLIFQIFILLAPLWINAFDYMVLGRMIQFFIPSRSIFGIPAPVLGAGFVGLDVVSFAIQLAGGSMAGPTAPPDKQMDAIHVYMGGIGIQQFFIIIFLGFAIKFHLEMLRLDRAGTLVGGQRKWRPLLFTLYATLGLISVRILFRLVEFSNGQNASNPIPHNERYFYAFEAVPMFIAILLLNIVHPGSVLVGLNSELPGVIAMIRSRRQRGRGKMLLADSDHDHELAPVSGGKFAEGNIGGGRV